MLSFELITKDEEVAFRRMLISYWNQIIPSSFLLTDPIQAEAEYQGRYIWDGGSNNPYWIFLGDQRVGFFMLRIYDDGCQAYIHDFFLIEEARRQGQGTELYHLLRSHLKEQGIFQVYLSVQADNPIALNFWKKQGFEIVYHRLSQPI